MYTFDKLTNRLNTSSTKWDRYVQRDNITDVIPLWVADMDFETVPEVTDVIIKRAKHSIFGYTDADDSVFEAICGWESRHHGVNLTKDNIILNTGVVYGLYQIIELLLTKNDKIIVQSPVYPPLFKTPLGLSRDVVFNELVREGTHYSIDLQDFEDKIKENPEIKMYIMCNPHNPIGHCYTLEEINKIFDICHKYNLWIVSDEIHADIIMPGCKHYSALQSEDKYHDKLIVLGSPTKTFNLAGLKISYALTKNSNFQKIFATEAKASGLSSINIFAFEAIKACYTYGDRWLEECIQYINDNFLYLDNYLKANLPKIKFKIPESTYLGWLDLSEYNLSDDFVSRLKIEAKVEFQSGSGFNKKYDKFIRINVACHRSTLEEGLNRLKSWLDKNG